MHEFFIGLGVGLVGGGALGYLYGSRVQSAALAELQKLRDSAASAIKGKG